MADYDKKEESLPSYVLSELEDLTYDIAILTEIVSSLIHLKEPNLCAPRLPSDTSKH